MACGSSVALRPPEVSARRAISRRRGQSLFLSPEMSAAKFATAFPVFFAERFFERVQKRTMEE